MLMSSQHPQQQQDMLPLNRNKKRDGQQDRSQQEQQQPPSDGSSSSEAERLLLLQLLGGAAQASGAAQSRSQSHSRSPRLPPHHRLPPPPPPARQQPQLDLIPSQAQAILAAELRQLQQLQLLQQQQQQQQQQVAYLRDALARPSALAPSSASLLYNPLLGGLESYAGQGLPASSDALRRMTDHHHLLLQQQQQQQQQQRLLSLERDAAALDAYRRLAALQSMMTVGQTHPLSPPVTSAVAAVAAASTSAGATGDGPSLGSNKRRRHSNSGGLVHRDVASPGSPATKKKKATTKSPPPSSPLPSMGSSSSAAGGSTTNPSATTEHRFPSERLGFDVVSGRCPSPDTAVKVLKAIGTTLRSKADLFVDVSRFPLQRTNMNEKRRGASVFFPEILHRLLCDAVNDPNVSSVVGWLPHHRAFRVHNKPLFERDVLPKYFVGQTKWSSFSRQLNLYGWLRVTSGPDYGAYYHELFLRDRPDLHSYMRRVGKPHLMDRRKHKLAEGDDPDLYQLSSTIHPSVPSAPASGAVGGTDADGSQEEEDDDDDAPASVGAPTADSAADAVGSEPAVATDVAVGEDNDDAATTTTDGDRDHDDNDDATEPEGSRS